MNTADDLIRLLNHSEHLEAIPRSGWLFSGVTQPESVAAHTCHVALVAIWLSDAVGADTAKVARMALVHDIAEAVITDIPSPGKREIDGIKRVEQRLGRQLLDASPSLQSAHDEYALGTSLEARIVKAADAVQMVAKACQYHRQNRGDVSRFLRYHATGIPLADAVIERLLQRSKSSDWSDLEYGS